jgi:hypothetical protein
MLCGRETYHDHCVNSGYHCNESAKALACCMNVNYVGRERANSLLFQYIVSVL